MLVSAEFDDGTQMSDQELRDQLLTLLLAGHETTATALAWTFDLLLHTPATLERLLAELETDETEYLDAVIDESLRVRPVVPMTGRLLREPANLGGYDLDTDTVVFAAIYMLHTNPEVYPDPFAFRPERFLDDGTETYSWIPFGGGTRRCIGAAFAELELRVVLREVLRSVRLEAADPRPQRMVRRNVTLTPADGTRVVASAAEARGVNLATFARLPRAQSRTSRNHVLTDPRRSGTPATGPPPCPPSLPRPPRGYVIRSSRAISSGTCLVYAP